MKSSKFDLQKRMVARSERVKCVDVHPNEPWILSCQYNGQVLIWNYETQVAMKTFHVSDLPVRCGKFIARQRWFICGADDLSLKIYNYNTHEKVATVSAHNDYIRAVAVHPSKSWVLSSSDDLMIKLWDWEKGWALIRTFEGHAHYVMSLAFNLKDPNTFASGSLDRTIKVWNVGSNTPNYTLEGHEKGVCSVAYSSGPSQPYLVSGGDDRLIRIWDYQNKHCVQTLVGHMNNVTCVLFHPSLALLISAGEDDTVRVWNLATFKQEKYYSLGMDRVWSLSVAPVGLGSLSSSTAPIIAIGTDKGVIGALIGGQRMPLMSIDPSGKVIWAKDAQVYQSTLKSILDSNEALTDGMRMTLGGKDFGQCDFVPSKLFYSPNGRFISVLSGGDSGTFGSEFVIYTALAWRNKTFGKGSDLIWSSDSAYYAVLETGNYGGKVQVYYQFEITNSILKDVTELFGPGPILTGIQSGYLCFWRWSDLVLLRRMEVSNVRDIYWSEAGDQVAIVTEKDGTFILDYNEAACLDSTSSSVNDDGFELAFSVRAELQESILSGLWIHSVFVFTTKLSKLMYYCGSGVSPSQPETTESGSTYLIASLDSPSLTLLYYHGKAGKLFLSSDQSELFSYTLSLPLIQCQLAVLRALSTENLLDDTLSSQVDQLLSEYLPQIMAVDKDRLTLAKFLQRQGLLRAAIRVSPDFEHAFQMALNLSDHSLALSMLEERCSTDATKYWLELAILALETKHLPLLIRCYKEAKQFDTLLIIYSMTKNYSALRDMAKQESIPVNLKFWAAILSKDRLTVCKALLDAKKYPELALFERTKLETKPELTPTWEKEWLQSIQEKGLKVNPLNNKQYQSDSILEIYQGHDNVSPDSFENHVDLATESFAVYDYQTKRSYGDSTDLISQMERLSTLDFPEEPSISKIEPDISNALNVSAASKSAVIETEILAKKNSLIGHDFDTFQPASRFDAFSSIEAEYPSTSTNQTSAMSPNLMDEEDDWFNGGNPESDQPQVPSNDDSFPDFSEQPSHFTAKPFPNFSPAQNSQSSSILLKPSFPTTQQQPDVFSEKAPISKIVNNQGNPLQVQAPKSPEILTSDSFLQTHHSSAFAFQESIVEDSFMAAPSSDDFVETNQWESSEFASEKPYEFSNSGKLSTLNNEVYSGFTDERRSDINSSIGFKVNSTFEYNTNPPAELNTNKPSSNMNSSQPLGSTGSTQSSGSNYKSAAVNPPALKLGGRPQPSSFPPQAGISNTKAFSKED